MIKRYNQFIRENDEFESSFEETEDISNETELNQEVDSYKEESIVEFEEEGEDLYSYKLKELADKLGAEVTDGKVHYEGKTIIFPSETDMYHVDKKKFKTSEEVVKYIKGLGNKVKVDPKEIEELVESRSYKSRFRI
jgi:HD-GYP domain-containing protein (c-di-GMP phosphodiesterase class II)